VKANGGLDKNRENNPMQSKLRLAALLLRISGFSFYFVRFSASRPTSRLLLAFEDGARAFLLRANVAESR
jgi:hypothetical protein